MKTLFKIIILLVPITGIGQSEISFNIDTVLLNGFNGSTTIITLDDIGLDRPGPTLFFHIESHINDQKIDTLCSQRGHEMPDVVFATSAYCPPYIIDTDTTSIKVYPACNEYEYECMRCGTTIREREKERRVVIWRKED